MGFKVLGFKEFQGFRGFRVEGFRDSGVFESRPPWFKGELKGGLRGELKGGCLSFRDLWNFWGWIGDDGKMENAISSKVI